MANEHFAKLSIDLICLMGQRLTKTEMVVLSYLYACRNEETRQCNPSRKTMMADIPIDKSNLSRAIKGLEEKHFIIESPRGFFALMTVAQVLEADDESDKVVNLTTKKVVNPTTVIRPTTEKVVESTTEVVNPTTESCEIDNLHYKELNREGNRERTENKRGKVGCRLPPSFSISDEMIDWAKARAPGVSVNLETEKFRNYWTAKAGRDAVKLDWQATWKNWMLKAQEWTGDKNGTIQKSGSKPHDAGSRNAERIDNTNAIIDELLRQGAAEQNLPRQCDVIG